ncbi:MAG: HlyD family efflux transporter periplasmic adaptor subunit [Oscillospiraceae bacterium]
MDTITGKVLVLILSIFLLVTVFHQVVQVFEDEYKTETAMVYSSAEKVTFNGVYVRNETVVSGGKSGVLSYPSPDGSKVAKDSVVAYVYKSSDDIYINQQIEKLRAEVEILKKEQNPGTTVVAQPEFISGLIDEKYRTITTLAARNDLASLETESDNFQMLMGIYQIVIGEETDYNDRIEQLEKQIKLLEAKQNNPIDIITVPNSGYFISYVDGYEEVFSTDNLSSITVDDIKDVIENDGYNAARVSKRAVGKIVDDYEWNLVGIVNPKDASFNPGKEVKVKLSSTPDLLDAKIIDVIETDDPEENVIVLSCEKLNFNLVQYRTERVEIILDDFNGIKVPREAIRFNKNNEKGVYVLLGQRIAFKKVDVIYECDDYLLSAITSDTDYISVYEDIILNGEIPAEVMEQVTVVSDTSSEPEGSEVSEATVVSTEETNGDDTANE